jgi:hypothetical protein
MIEKARINYGSNAELVILAKFVFENVGDVDGSEGGKLLVFAQGRFMMKGSGVDDRERQVPHTDQATTDFTVIRAKHLFFNFPDRNGLFAREGMNASIQIVKVCGEDHFAEVVDESGHESL